MPEQFGSFTASELFCPKCEVSQPVREKLLLILPSGELHEYLCRSCGTSLGERKISGEKAATQPRPAPTRRLLR